MKPQKIEISQKTIIFSILFLLGVVALWYVRSIVVLLFLCFIFMEAINPTVNRLEKLKIPRPLAIIFLYLILFTTLFFAFSGLIPVLIQQTTDFINEIPYLAKNTTFFGTSALDISSQFKIIETLPNNVAKLVVSIFSNIFSTFLVFVITFYLLLERKKFDKYSFSFLGPKFKEIFLKIVDNLELRLGNWVSAEIILMTIIGILSYLGYLFLGIKFAVPLAIIAGLLEIIPTVGPTIAVILAALIGLTISPMTALLIVIWGVVVQQLENNFLVPKIMGKACGLNPLVTILLLLTGTKLAGFIGAILAIPIYLTIEVIFKVILENTKKLQRNC